MSKRNDMIILFAVLVMLIAIIVLPTTACRQAERVSYNLSQEADSFNVVRRLTVINCFNGDVLFQMTGKMSLQNSKDLNELQIIVEDENGNYQKHFVGLSDNVTYTVEQLKFKNVENYKFTINFNPKMWLPVNIDTID